MKYIIRLANWLPDSQHLLMTIDTTNGKNSIEILNTTSGELQLYAERNGIGRKPIWIDSLQTVIYPTTIKMEIKSFG